MICPIQSPMMVVYFLSMIVKVECSYRLMFGMMFWRLKAIHSDFFVASKRASRQLLAFACWAKNEVSLGTSGKCIS